MKFSNFILILTLGFLFLNNVQSLFAQKERSNIRKANNGVYVIAHRGAHIGNPENSLAAYQKAIDFGCDFVEIDVRTTKDNQFVSIHNTTIDTYVDGVHGKVSEFTLAELKSFDIGSKVGVEWKDTSIPTFEEILKLCKGKIGIYLDLKAASIPALVEIIKKYGMETDILWYIPASYMKEIKELTYVCPKCVPMPDVGHETNIEPFLNQVNAKMLATDMGELTENFVKIAHLHQVLVTVDEKEGTPAEWTKIIEWKTDGIQTDHPNELISFLKERYQRAKR